MWNAEAAIAIDENPDIKVVFPTEGGAISMDNYAILKGVKHKDAEYVKAVPYDVPIIGDHNHAVNTLRLWSAEPSDRDQDGD